jgi:uncharacterized protein (TIGR03118 family)
VAGAHVSTQIKETWMTRTIQCALGLSLLAGTLLGGATRREPPLNFYQQRNLVSDGFIKADHTDPNLVNAWGLQFNPRGPWWVADNGSGLSTLYDQTGAINALVVTVEPPEGAQQSAPTGIVFNAGAGFVTTEGAASGPAAFIFSTEDGTIAAWAPAVPPPPPSHLARIEFSATDGAVYKGIAIGNNGSGDFLYATDFHNGKIDVFDSSFHPTALDGHFSDPNIPAHFAPFGIRNINDRLYVTYALQNAEAHDDVAGPGNGFIDIFDLNGHLQRRLVSGGVLNSPWGMALAPDNFGKVSGRLIVGNFGNGRINTFDPATGANLGPLLGPRGGPIRIDGLWALSFGNNASAGPTNVLFFTAGPDHEAHGLFGSLTAVPPGNNNKNHD